MSHYTLHYAAQLSDMLYLPPWCPNLALNMQITPGQVKFLKQLQVPRTDYEKLTKTEASALIDAKLDEKNTAPPTAAQLKMLQVIIVAAECSWHH